MFSIFRSKRPVATNRVIHISWDFSRVKGIEYQYFFSSIFTSPYLDIDPILQLWKRVRVKTTENQVGLLSMLRYFPNQWYFGMKYRNQPITT